MLIDGGVSKAFREKVLPLLARTNDRPIDCLYVSHIDNDHLGGLIVLVDALYDWRVYSFRKGKKPAPKKPAVPQPPDLLKIWHNVFSDLLEENADPVAAALAHTATIFSGLGRTAGTDAKVRDYHDNLAEGAKEAIRLSYRVGAEQLGVKVNPEYRGGLMYLTQKRRPALKHGKATFTLIGPRAEDLDKLRLEWNEWLEKHKALVNGLRRTAGSDAGELTSAADLVAPLELEARTLVDRLATPDLAARADELGKRGKVTTPNLASLMFLVEEGRQSLLLTGDGHATDIIAGLKERGKLRRDGTLHVNVLKVPHHGAEYNTTIDFARDVTADHYVFCGNGFQGNPEPVVLDTIAKQRAAAPFTFWFNSTPSHNAHMKDIAALTKKIARKNPGFKAVFSDQPFDVPFA
jgi:hypothetical protein